VTAKLALILITRRRSGRAAAGGAVGVRNAVADGREGRARAYAALMPAATPFILRRLAGGSAAWIVTIPGGREELPRRASSRSENMAYLPRATLISSIISRAL